MDYPYWRKGSMGNSLGNLPQGSFPEKGLFQKKLIGK